MMNDRIVIGKVLKPQGIKGEIKVSGLTDDLNRFYSLKTCFIEDIEYSISSVRVNSGYVYLYLKGIFDRDAAERLRDRFLEVDRENAVSLPEDRFFICDVVKCSLYFEDGTLLGKMKDVSGNQRVDIYTATVEGGKQVMFPALKDVIETYDVKEERIVLNKNRFYEVAVFED